MNNYYAIAASTGCSACAKYHAKHSPSEPLWSSKPICKVDAIISSILRMKKWRQGRILFMLEPRGFSKVSGRWKAQVNICILNDLNVGSLLTVFTEVTFARR